MTTPEITPEPSPHETSPATVSVRAYTFTLLGLLGLTLLTSLLL